MKLSKKTVSLFLAAVLMITSMVTSAPIYQLFAAEPETHGAFVISGGTYGVDYEYVTGTSPIQVQGYGTNESVNSTASTPKSGGVVNVAMDVLKIYTSTPLTISTNGTSNAGIMIEKGVNADLTFDGVTINTYIPVNIVPNRKEINSYGRPVGTSPETTDENGDGVIDYLENPTSLHLTLADGSVNTLTATQSSYTYQFPGLRCGEGAKLTIDDGRRNVDTDGNFVAPADGRVSRDATLQDGTIVKEGDRLTLLDSVNPGSLTVYGGYRAAAIGGAALESSGDMTFNGGNIVVRAYGVAEALSGYGAGAGIGGGHAGCGTVMTFNGGNIDAYGSYHGAGVGGGCTYGGGMSSSTVTYALTDGYLSQYPLSTVAGDININGGFLKSVGCTHSNAFGQACGGTNNGKTITITGGTLLPSSVPGWYDIGGSGGDVIVTGGSVRLTNGDASKFQSNGGVAWGNLEKTIKVFMTTINMSGYGKANMLVDGMKMTVNGIPSEYGMPSYTDESGNLYFWLPNTEDGTAPEVRVDLNLKDKDTGEAVVTEPFFITNATHGAALKQYVVFNIDDSLITDENRLKKRYDGLSFTGEQQTAFLDAVVKDGISVAAPAGQFLTDVSKMSIQSQRLDENLDVDESESITNGTNANVGKYQLTITSSQYAATTGFKDAFWGHRCYYKYAEITPADSKTLISVKPVSDDIEANGKYYADTELELKAYVSPADAEATTCEAPTGDVQFYINGKAYGKPVAIEAATGADETNASGHKQSVASIKWTPTQDSGKFAAEGIQSIYAKYVVEDKDNYNGSKSDAAEIELLTVDQGNEDKGGKPIKVTDTSDDTEIPADNSKLDKIYGDSFQIKLEGGDTEETPVFESSDPSIAVVDKDGNITIVGVGEVIITATRPGNGAYNSQSQQITVTAKKKELTIDSVDILDKYYDGDVTAEYDPDSVVINGMIEKDKEKVKDQLKGEAVFPDSKAGTYADASVKFTLTGDLAKFYFLKQSDSSEGSSIVLKDSASILAKPLKPSTDDQPGGITVDPIKDQSWTGEEITPPVVVKDGDKVLVYGVDYTVEFKNNIDVGTADVIIKGIGDYQGTLNTEFKIVPINIDTDKDGIPDVNIDTDGDGEPDINIDTDGDLEPDINIDTDGDGEPDINIDTDGDGEPDINIDTDGDDEPDVNIDEDGDGKVDTYVYINYVTADGKVLSEQIVKRGNMGDAYSSEQITDKDVIYGYRLVAVPENASGVMNQVSTTVNYVYERKKTSVIVNYLDNFGKEIADSVVINGEVFDEFDTERKRIYGFKLIDITDNKPSVFSRLRVVFADFFADEKELVDVSGTMEEETIVINYIYELRNSDVTVKYVDENGKEIEQNETINGKVFDKYNTQAKDIYAYEFVSVSENASGEMTEDSITVVYTYKQVLNIDTDGDGEPDVNIDTDGDGEPDINIDTDGDDKPDVNIDTDKDGKPDVNVDTDDDGKPDINIDTDGDGKPDVDIDTDGDDKPDVNIDTDKDGKPDVNVDTDDDGKPDINIDTDGDGKPDVDIDTDGDDKPDVNIDTDKDGKPDVNVDTDDDGKPDINIDTDGDGKPDINIDTDGDGKPDVNIDTDGDGKPDVNIDTDGDGKPDVNIDTDGDGKPDVNIDTDGDGKPDVNVDTDGDGKPDINIDTDGDGKADIDIDTDGDSKPDVNIDTDGDKKADINIDTTGDGKADTNIDTDGDGKADINIDTNGDGKADANLDTDGDGIADTNLIGVVDTGSTDMIRLIMYSAVAVFAVFLLILVTRRKESEAE